MTVSQYSPSSSSSSFLSSSSSSSYSSTGLSSSGLMVTTSKSVPHSGQDTISPSSSSSSSRSRSVSHSGQSAIDFLLKRAVRSGKRPVTIFRISGYRRQVPREDL